MRARGRLIAPLLLIACKDKGDETPTWHRDIAPIVTGRCVGCHTTGAIGGFPLETYEQVSQLGDLVASVTEARTMPPWGAVPGHTEYAHDRSLSDAQIQDIQDWVEAGMPEGDPADAGEPLPEVGVSLPEVDVSLDMPEAYTPTLEPDDYRCFPVAWTATEDSYVTGFEVHPDNDTVVHHVAAFLIRPDSVGGDLTATLAEWDAAEEGPGYTCFGGPSRTGEDVQVPVQQLGQWVPGNQAVLFPEGSGILVPAGSSVVLQMHYNLEAWDGAPDQTSIDFDTAPTVEHEGAFAPWLDAVWTYGAMSIPAGETTTYEKEGDPTGFWGLFMGEEMDLDAGFDIHAVMLHMHQIGQSGLVRVDDADGSSQVLLEVADWDFHWQLNYQLAEAVHFDPEDSLYLSCTFDNTAGAEDVSWGEGSGDEMCVGNLFITEP